jgi:hypothetical protein
MDTSGNGSFISNRVAIERALRANRIKAKTTQQATPAASKPAASKPTNGKPNKATDDRQAKLDLVNTLLRQYASNLRKEHETKCLLISLKGDRPKVNAAPVVSFVTMARMALRTTRSGPKV